MWALGAHSIRVAPHRYVGTMSQHSNFVAGELREDLNDAFDHVRIVDLVCGCLGFSGSLPFVLSQSITRALKTIDAEQAHQNGYQHHDDAPNDPVRELLHRLGRADRASPGDDPEPWYGTGDAA